MRFSWDERERRSNLKVHGLDFRDVPKVLEGLTFTFEDDRCVYGEQRWVSLGSLNGVAVSVVHTENPGSIRVIPLRRATRHEEAILFENIAD